MAIQKFWYKGLSIIKGNKLGFTLVTLDDNKQIDKIFCYGKIRGKYLF